MKPRRRTRSRAAKSGCPGRQGLCQKTHLHTRGRAAKSGCPRKRGLQTRVHGRKGSRAAESGWTLKMPVPVLHACQAERLESPVERHKDGRLPPTPNRLEQKSARDPSMTTACLRQGAEPRPHTVTVAAGIWGRSPWQPSN